MTPARVLLALALAAFVPTRGAAQPVTLVPPDFARWDAVVTVGWLGGDKAEQAESWNNWYDTFATAVDVGRYWTPHVKAEAGVLLTTEGRVFSQVPIELPGRPGFYYVSREHRFTLRAVNAAVAWQFFENAWAHPFVAAGVQVAAERRRVETLPSGAPLPLPLPPDEPPRTAASVQPLLSAGSKFYVSERGFIRTDLSASFDRRGAARVWWRIGAGIDF